MKSKTERVLHILREGGQIELDTGHTLCMSEEGLVAIKVLNKENTCSLLDYPINEFIKLCNDLTEEQLVGGINLNSIING